MVGLRSLCGDGVAVFAQHERNALHDGVRHVKNIVLLPQTPEHARRVGVKFRCVRTHKVRQEDQRILAAAREQDAVHLVIAGLRHAGPAEPFQADAAGLGDREHDVRIRQEAVVHGDPAVARRRFLRHDGEGHDRAGRERDAAGANVAGADHARKVVERADVHERVLRQAERLRGGRSQRPGDAARLDERRQPGLVNADGVEHLRPVVLFVDIKIECEGGDGHIGKLPTRQAEDDIVLEQHEGLGGGKDVWPVLFQPEDLRRGPGRQECLLPGDALAERGVKLRGKEFAFLGRALIHPGDRVHTGAALRVHANERFRLTGKRDLTDLRYAAVARELRDERGKLIIITLRVKFHEAGFPQILDRAALLPDELHRSIINGSLDVGAAKVNAKIHVGSSIKKALHRAAPHGKQRPSSAFSVF